MSVVHYGKNLYRSFQFRQLLKKPPALTAEAAGQLLLDFYPKSPPRFRQENILDPQYDVMIIVPVYNVEPYLEACIHSVLHQETRYTYQVVFVNDGSRDASGEILDRLVTAPHVVIHKKNGGLSAARNDALRRITGRYLMFVDSDDMLSPNAVERLVSTADTHGADIVEGSHVFFGEGREPEVFSHGESIHPIHYLELYGFACGKVIAAELARDFCFPEGYLFEDTVMSTLLHPAGKHHVAIPDVIYRYRDNFTGITHTSKEQKSAMDTFWMMKYCLQERIARGDRLTTENYARYLISVRRNWVRTAHLPDGVREAIFVCTCELFHRCLPFRYEGTEKRMHLLEQAIQNHSYEAYRFLMERWDIL